MAHRGVRVGSFTGAVVWTVMVVAGAAGCGGGAGDELPGATPPSPQVEPSAPAVGLTAAEQEAVGEVLKVFDSYLEVFVELAIEGVDLIDLSWTGELGQYGLPRNDVADSSLLEENHLQGRVAVGTLDWELVDVAEVDLERSEPWVSIQVCVDETNWRAEDLATGEVVAGPGTRHVATVGAVYRSDKFSQHRPEPAWRLTDWEGDRSTSC